MNKIRAKMGKKGGFTLVEMLIVVAIIAILVAISIPLISNALERARHATDAANERAAKAEVLIEYLTEENHAAKTYFYDAVNGVVKNDISGIKGYGKHDRTGVDHADKIIAINVDTAGVVKMQWVAENGSVVEDNWDKNLCLSATDMEHKTVTGG